MAKSQSQFAQDLKDLTDVVSKIGNETRGLQTLVEQLQLAIDNGNAVSPEVQAAFDALKAQVTVVDQLVPDAPTAPAEGQ